MSRLRMMVIAIGLASCGPGGRGKSEPAPDTSHAQPLTRSHQEEHLTAAQILALLKEGNKKFVSKLSPTNIAHDSSYNYYDQILQTGASQHPIACVLTCMDSRVPPEIIFEQGIGNLFVLRVAGNIEDDDMMGSMEYAVKEKNVSLIVVMGHSNCGAINAAFSNVDPKDKELYSLIAHVKKDIIAGDKPPYDASARHNVKLTIENILKYNELIKNKYESGELIIAGALYNVANGTVDWDFKNW